MAGNGPRRRFARYLRRLGRRVATSSAVRLVVGVLAWLGGWAGSIGLALGISELLEVTDQQRLAVVAACAGSFVVGSGLVLLLGRWRRAVEDPLTQAVHRLHALGGAGFEERTVELLDLLGYRSVERVGGSGDGGADVLCRDDLDRLVLVQCKCYKPRNRLGPTLIREVIGARTGYDAARGMVVTTATFTSGAWDHALEHDIDLIDGRMVAWLFAAADPSPGWQQVRNRPLAPPPAESPRGRRRGA